MKGSLTGLPQAIQGLVTASGRKAKAEECHLGVQDPGDESQPLAAEGAADGSPLVGLLPHQAHGNGGHGAADEHAHDLVHVAQGAVELLQDDCKGTCTTRRRVSCWARLLTMYLIPLPPAIMMHSSPPGSHAGDW